MTPREIIDKTFTEWHRDKPMQPFGDMLLAAFHTAGYKVLTREPTPTAVIGAMRASWDTDADGMETIWRAMWDAAP